MCQPGVAIVNVVVGGPMLVMVILVAVIVIVDPGVVQVVYRRGVHDTREHVTDDELCR
jgi:hypothetical protein